MIDFYAHFIRKKKFLCKYCFKKIKPYYVMKNKLYLFKTKF